MQMLCIKDFKHSNIPSFAAIHPWLRRQPLFHRALSCAHHYGTVLARSGRGFYITDSSSRTKAAVRTLNHSDVTLTPPYFE